VMEQAARENADLFPDIAHGRSVVTALTKLARSGYQNAFTRYQGSRFGSPAEQQLAVIQSTSPQSHSIWNPSKRFLFS
jgi:hypothetical protein